MRPTLIEARGKMVFPGAVDSHYHIGIYRPFSEDAETESRSSLIGGVTTLLSYFRTGHHYLNKTGPYREIFPEVLQLSAGHFYTDYGFHLAIMTAEQLPEVGELVETFGVGSFKFYMFYKALNLAADSTRGSDYTMAENYDLGHLFLLMEQVAAISRKHASKGRIALSLHCENPELIRVFIDCRRSRAFTPNPARQGRSGAQILDELGDIDTGKVGYEVTLESVGRETMICASGVSRLMDSLKISASGSCQM